MPSQRVHLAYAECFTEDEFARIQFGLIPLEMEDRWFIYWEEPWLHVHYGWTGHELYAVKFVRVEPQWCTEEAFANRNPKQSRSLDEVYDTQLLRCLIRVLLLGQNAEWPKGPTQALPIVPYKPPEPRQLPRMKVTDAGKVVICSSIWKRLLSRLFGPGSSKGQ
jgi:hypothetical protein